MTVGIVRSAWSGTSGGPGLTQLAFYASGGADPTTSQAQSAVNAVKSFWEANKPYLPNEVTIQVQPVVDLYDDITAVLTGSVTVTTAPASTTGGATGNYAGGCGYKYDWNTGVILGGRRVVGRTYVVPAAGACFDLDGSITPTILTALNTAASNFLSTMNSGGLNLAVWTRPGGINSVPGVTGVISGTVKDKSAILRGRRD